MATSTATAPARPRPSLIYSEILSFAYDTFCSNKIRFALTALGMVIGTASLILVVTIGMTGKQYVLNQIQAIGANLIEAEYQGGAQRITNTTPDPLTIDDMHAAMRDVPGVVAASPIVQLDERVAVGKVLKLSGLPFTIVGTFKERVDTFGQSEVVDYTMVIPYTVSRYFTETTNVKQIYFSVADPSMVGPATEQIRRVIQARHRAESVYNVTNLTQLVAVAEKTANALTIVLLLVAAVVLLVSGIGIMNIMLATVSARIREIGIRKALGATKREIQFQFLAEAILISLIGGLLGVIIGLALPFSVGFLTA